MKKVLLTVFFASVVSACATTNSDGIKMPKGKWYEVNPKGYIPPSADVYVKSGSDFELQNSQVQPNKGAE